MVQSKCRKFGAAWKPLTRRSSLFRATPSTGRKNAAHFSAPYRGVRLQREIVKFQLEKFNRNISEEELIDDLKKSFETLRKNSISFSFRSYSEIGKFSSSTISTRFGSWNKALEAAGIEVMEEKNISDVGLFLNLENVWVILGRQPVTRDMVKPLSKYSSHTYSERFGSWRKALSSFVDYINEEEPPISQEIIQETPTTKSIKRRTSRNISDRMRFRILSRDGFTCQSCGASPIKERGVELHVDHVLPWSKGGETEESNLQTKCKQCNLGKGNAFNQ
ncbi:MAG: endonuclease [SAR86 cluster bacterium]|uniref:Endonuclease n=1 Tax=SAR86 cluster bacterium TaxID=2030880 RepID=A0A2A5CJE8_9GAMM|nr:MAG: endonuclease [SAR86 cluster bacterium]